MYVLTEYVVRGILAGSIYGLLALPMSLLFATVRTIDFAVGAYALLAAAVATSSPARSGSPPASQRGHRGGGGWA